MSEGDAEAFHTIVAKLMFLCKWEQPVILTGVLFLTTRAREPNKEDDKKLRGILKYLSGMRDLMLTLESDGTVTVNGGQTPCLRCTMT